MTGPSWSDVTGITPAMWTAVRDLSRLFGNRLFLAMAWQGALLAVGGLRCGECRSCCTSQHPKNRGEPWNWSSTHTD